MAASRARFGGALFPFLLIVACVAPWQVQTSGQTVQELSTISVPIRASLAPLVPEIEARVPKTFADKIAREANREAGKTLIPHSVFTRAPSAEHRVN